MRRFIIVISLLSSVYADRRCLLHRGTCVSHCPRDMHTYHTRCDGQTISQRTCEAPLVYVIGYSCGWSRCDCNGNLLFDEDTGFCVTEENCSKFSARELKAKHGTGRKKDGKRRYHLSKRIRIKEEDLMEQE